MDYREDDVHFRKIIREFFFQYGIKKVMWNCNKYVLWIDGILAPQTNTLWRTWTRICHVCIQKSLGEKKIPVTDKEYYLIAYSGDIIFGTYQQKPAWYSYISKVQHDCEFTSEILIIEITELKKSGNLKQFDACF